MFSKRTLFVSAAVVLTLGLQVNAHAGVTPALGVTGTFARKNVQRPSTAKPCGKIALTAIDTSTPVVAAADGTMTMNITNFNAGKDGSRAIKTLRVDTTGTGQTFTAVPASAITKNGVAAPSSKGTEQLVVTLPAGTTCTGGKTKDLCLMSFTTDGGFGNCVVAQQGAGATGSSTTVATGAVAAGNSTTTDTTATGSGSSGSGKGSGKKPKAKAAGAVTAGNSTTTDTDTTATGSGSSGSGKGTGKKPKAKATGAVGSRAARAYLAQME